MKFPYGISEQDALDLPDKISNIVFDCCASVIIPEVYTIQVFNKTVLVIEIYPGGLRAQSKITWHFHASIHLA